MRLLFIALIIFLASMAQADTTMIIEVDGTQVYTQVVAEGSHTVVVKKIVHNETTESETTVVVDP